MEFPIKFDTDKSGWSIIYMRGLRLYFMTKIVFLSLKTHFALANREDPDEMLQYAAFHLGLHCLPKYVFIGFWSSNGLNINSGLLLLRRDQNVSNVLVG